MKTAKSKALDLETVPVHLGIHGNVIPLPKFTGEMAWYQEYEQNHATEPNGRLVSTFTFDSNWTSWEMHPHGEELVLCTAGSMTVIQELNGKHQSTVLSAGQYVINKAGVWHTADVTEKATALFITAGLGTQHRER
jgi:mannose-6-phosphate isomerase-like protein (cupin superfamily)